jgi:transposase InsO family protein
VKYAWIKEFEGTFPISAMCKVLKVSRSKYYAWLKKPCSDRAKEDKALTEKIRDVFTEGRRLYGARKIKSKLQQYKITISRRRISRLMKIAGLKLQMKRKYKATTDSKHSLAISPNLLERQFNVAKQDSVWAGDITYIRTKAGWLYLATVMDLYSRKIVGWSMNNSMKAELVNNAILMAISIRRPSKGLIWHTDRGSQYCAKSHRSILKKHGIVQSMSRKGDCWDNATSESFFSILKRELVELANFTCHKQAAAAIFEYIEVFYNRIRLHSTIGYLAPAEFEESKKDF